MSIRSRRRGKNPDANKLIIYHNPTGAATFDPQITTSVSTTVIWQTEAGVTITTGTTHDLSYTPTAGPKKCTITVRGGLGLVTEVNCREDALLTFKNLKKCSALASLIAYTNTLFQLDGPFPKMTSIAASLLPNSVPISWFPSANTLDLATSCFGNVADINRNLDNYINMTGNAYVIGSISNLPVGTKIAYLYSCTGITPASIAHLIAIRDLRIYSMGWTAQQNTDVLLSAWAARANYTYASNIALRISAPTGTVGTEPPAAGVSNDDWSWNAETSRHDPLTGYAAIGDLQTDFYSEGFKPWVVTIV
ncbi:MAG: hypothetical protein WC455_21260 [Dehalococcoidia bacterium]|jgi:hypothetical protein